MRKLHGYTSDDGKVTGTAAEVRAYEARQALRAWLAGTDMASEVDVILDDLVEAMAAAPDEAIALIAALKGRPGRGKGRKPRKPRMATVAEARA